MKLGVTIFPSGDLRKDAELIRQAERLGFDAAYTTETARNPFLPLTIAAKETSTIQLGTQIAVAFPRSPMVTAQIAWDLARQTEGRFILGLGAQSKEHIERRFSEEWSDPVGRMREYIESIRAIWNTFQTDARLRYRGRHYQFRLMSPFFNPGPIEHPEIPIYLAGGNPQICQLAGELYQGLHAHAFHSPGYLREVIQPAVDQGLQMAQRERSDFSLAVPVMLISGYSEAEQSRAESGVRTRLGYYADTPAFQRVMSLRGWDELAEELAELARAGQWDALPDRITDEMLDEFAIIAEPDEVLSKIVERYDGLADQVCLEWNGENRSVIKAIARSR